MKENTKKKRILYVIDTLGAGGAERQLIYIIEGLDRNRYEPHILTLYDEHATPYHFQPELDALGVPIHSLHLRQEVGSGRAAVMRLLKGIAGYTKLMWRLRPRIVQGCLHTSNLITRIGRLCTPPHKLITMIQSIYNPKQLRSEKATAFLTSHIIANSAANYAHLRDVGQLTGHNLSYINCGVQLEAFMTTTQPQIQPEFKTEITFLAVMVARIDPRKGHLLLLQAISRLKLDLPLGFRVMLVGEISVQETQAELDAFITAHGLASFIIQLPPTHDVSAYYHMADVVLLPSLTESFGLVIVEAFAAKKPIIVSQAANVLGIVREGENGWVFPTGDVTALAQVLVEAAHAPPETLRAMGKHGFTLVPQFDVGVMVEKYRRLYEN